jgi:hypothetical protein
MSNDCCVPTVFNLIVPSPLRFLFAGLATVCGPLSSCIKERKGPNASDCTSGRFVPTISQRGGHKYRHLTDASECKPPPTQTQYNRDSPSRAKIVVFSVFQNEAERDACKDIPIFSSCTNNRGEICNSPAFSAAYANSVLTMQLCTRVIIDANLDPKLLLF